MDSTFPAMTKKVIDQLLTLCAIGFLLSLVYLHVQLIAYPAPIDPNESVHLSVTNLFAAGESPYDLAHQPAEMHVYTPLYNIVVAPFSQMFGNTFFLHRAINGLCILASVFLCFFVAKKEGASSRNSLLAAVLIYAGLQYYSTPISSPNGLGLLLFLSSILVPWFFAFSNRSLAAALILGILGFYSKQYFFASLGYVALYVFLAVSKQRAIVFGLLSLLTFLASLVVMHKAFPYFMDNTMLGTGTMEQGYLSWAASIRQLREYGEIYAPIIVILAIYGAHTLWQRRRGNASARTDTDNRISQGNATSFNIGSFSAPLLAQKPNYVWYCFIVSLVIITCILGRNPGNHLTYLFQFMSPFLLIGTLVFVSQATSIKWLYQLLLALFLYNNYAMLSYDFHYDEENWTKLREIVADADTIYASSWLDGEIVSQGKQLYRNAATPYFVFSVSKPDFFVKENPQERLIAIWDNYANEINARIENKEFDLIILDGWTTLPATFYGGSPSGKPLLRKYYYRSEVIRVAMIDRNAGGTTPISIWKPKPRPVDINKKKP